MLLVSIVLATSQPAFATIDNTAKAIGSYGTQVVISNDDTAQVPVSGAAALQVTKQANPDTNLVAGDVVTYTYVVRNAGTQTVTNISLSDAHDGTGPPPVPGNEGLSTDAGNSNDSSDATPNDGIWSVLAPGDEVTLTATYTVTQTDIDTRQ